MLVHGWSGCDGAAWPAEPAGGRKLARPPPEPEVGSPGTHAGARNCRQGLRAPTDRCPRSSLSMASVVFWPGRSWPRRAHQGADGVQFRCNCRRAAPMRRGWQELSGVERSTARPCAGPCTPLAEPFVQHGGAVGVVASFGGSGSRPSPLVPGAPAGLGRCTLSLSTGIGESTMPTGQASPFPTLPRVARQQQQRPRGRAQIDLLADDREDSDAACAVARRDHASS